MRNFKNVFICVAIFCTLMWIITEKTFASLDEAQREQFLEIDNAMVAQFVQNLSEGALRRELRNVHANAQTRDALRKEFERRKLETSQKSPTKSHQVDTPAQTDQTNTLGLRELQQRARNGSLNSDCNEEGQNQPRSKVATYRLLRNPQDDLNQSPFKNSPGLHESLQKAQNGSDVWGLKASTDEEVVLSASSCDSTVKAQHASPENSSEIHAARGCQIVYRNGQKLFRYEPYNMSEQ